MKKHHPKILVLGDVGLDHYLHGTVYGTSPEAPIPVLKVEREEFRLGMAANVAVNLRNLTKNVELWSFFALTNRETALFSLKLKLAQIKHKRFDEGFPLIIKQRGVHGTTYISRNDYEIVAPIDIIPSLKKHIKELKKFEAIILSDYGKNVIGKPEELIRFLKEVNPSVKIFVDPDKNKNVNDYNGVYCIKANEKESLAITGSSNVYNAMFHLGVCCQYPIITRGANLGLYWDKQKTSAASYFKPKLVEQVDVIGAGDSFIASLVYNICLGKTLKQSLNLACKEAAKTVEKFGT